MAIGDDMLDDILAFNSRACRFLLSCVMLVVASAAKDMLEKFLLRRRRRRRRQMKKAPADARPMTNKAATPTMIQVIWDWVMGTVDASGLRRLVFSSGNAVVAAVNHGVFKLPSVLCVDNSEGVELDGTSRAVVLSDSFCNAVDVILPVEMLVLVLIIAALVVIGTDVFDD